MTPGRRLAALTAMVVGGVTACSAVTPSGPTLAPVTPVAATASPPPIASQVPSPTASAVVLGELGRRLDIRSVSDDFASRVLEFVANGSSIIASAAEGDGDAAAPDLYAIVYETGEAQLVWRNPERDHSIVKLAADGNLIAFVDMATTGEAQWTLRVIPDPAAEPVILDQLTAEPGVSTLVPSVTASSPYVVWTAFHAGPDGPVSQMFAAKAPRWEPVLLAERPAMDAELWFPSLLGSRLVYTELIYAADHLTDERTVWLTDVGASDAPRQLSASGLATMPIINQYDIAWKEGDAGFHQLNWGSMERYVVETGRLEPMWYEDSINFPSAGIRFMTWSSAWQDRIVAWDGRQGQVREILTTDGDVHRVSRVHAGGTLLAWQYVDDSAAEPIVEIWYARLPQ